MCELVVLERSTYYYRAEPAGDQAVRSAILDVAGRFPRYGYLRVYAQLKRDHCGAVESEWQVRCLMADMGLKVRKTRRKRHTTNSNHAFQRYPNLVLNTTIHSPNHVWVSDIKYVHTRREDIYLAITVDVFTRCIRGWELSRSLDTSLSLGALRKALCQSIPRIHHSDQGVQYACSVYTSVLDAAGVNISMADVGQAWHAKRGYAERFIGTVEDEEVSLSDYEDFHDAYNHAWRAGSLMMYTCGNARYAIHRWAGSRQSSLSSSGRRNCDCYPLK